MTDKEKAVVMAHTGICMLTGEKFSIYHKYIEELMDRPVFTHELANAEMVNQIKEKSKEDFLKLCKDEFVPESCDDCISRAGVEQTVEDNILCYTHSDRPIDQDPDTECHMAIRLALRMLRKDLRKLPPVTPKIGTGKWIYKKVNWYCSECGCTPKTLGYIGDAEFMKKHFKFCNHCGAMMLDAVMTEDEEKANESGQMQDL